MENRAESYFAQPSTSSSSVSSVTSSTTFGGTSRNDSNLFKTPPPRPRPQSRVPTSGLPSSSSFSIRREPATPVSDSVSTSSRGITTPSSTSSRASTPSSSSSTSRTIDQLDRSTVLAMVEGRGHARGEVGIAIMNMKTPTVVLCQFTDTQTYSKVISKVNLFRPYEILMPATACDTITPTQLCLQLQKEVPTARIIPIQRRIFNDARGLQKLIGLAADPFSPLVHSITNKYYCLAAVAALLKYIELIQSIVFPPKTLKVEFQGSDQTCMIDFVTGQHLELLQNNQQPTSKQCLLGVVDDCRTPIGARLLRMNILQPFCDVELINTRLNCIEELVNNRDLLYSLQDILNRLPVDIEFMIATLVQIPKVDNNRVTQQRINHMIALKHTLDLIPTLIEVMQKSENEYFKSVKRDLEAPEFPAMLETIKRILQDEVQFQKGSMNMKRQRCFAVKANVNPILDIARDSYIQIINDINDYILELSQQVGLPFRLGTNNQRGFYIQFYLTGDMREVPPLPSYFLQVRKRGNIVTFTTETLVSCDNRSKEISTEIDNLSGRVISELIATIRTDIGHLYKVSEAIAQLDVIYSLANYALTTPQCVRPSFSQKVTAITMGRHPLLEAITTDPAVPNSTFLSEDVNFTFITGPNMSGKTTYIKQVATLQVLAQIGSFVTAEAATFKIATNILSRIGAGDNIEENASSFGIELTEMKYILHNACESSLIIIDEFGRATSFEEGASISWAIAEALLNTNAFVMFATHHLILTKFEKLVCNVLNFTMETEEWGQLEDENTDSTHRPVKLRYTYRLQRGVTEVEFYGLKLAAGTAVPRRIVCAAMDNAKKITESRQNNTFTTTEESRNAIKKNKFMLSSLLIQAQDNFLGASNLNLTDVKEFAKSLNKEFKMMCGDLPNP